MKQGTSQLRIFSWRALLLAPLIMPILASAALTIGADNKNAFLAFLMLTIAGSVISYASTAVLLLPCLSLLRQRTALTLARTSLLGAALGIVVFLPLSWLMWSSSGPDSGPPIDTFLESLITQASDPFNAFFPIAGAITSAAYWLLLPRRRGGC